MFSGKSQIIHGDCAEVLKSLPNGIITLLYTNPPFGITQAKWDTKLDWDALWPEIWRIMKPNGCVVLHSSMPFTFDLVASQRKHFKYNYVWVKNTHTGFFQAKYQPLRKHEDVCVFYKQQPTYNPQMFGNEFHKKRLVKHGGSEAYWGQAKFDGNWGIETEEGGHYGRFPDTVLNFNTTKASPGQKKPSTRTVEMIDFFIKTYSNVGDIVLDITCNDAITGERAICLDRKYIGIEKSEEYAKIAMEKLHLIKSGDKPLLTTKNMIE